MLATASQASLRWQWPRHRQSQNAIKEVGEACAAPSDTSKGAMQYRVAGYRESRWKSRKRLIAIHMTYEAELGAAADATMSFY